MQGLVKDIYSNHHPQIQMLDTLSMPNFHFWEGVTAVSGKPKGDSVSGIGCAELVRLALSEAELKPARR
jgi:hypothetical protein